MDYAQLKINTSALKAYVNNYPVCTDGQPNPQSPIFFWSLLKTWSLGKLDKKVRNLRTFGR